MKDITKTIAVLSPPRFLGKTILPTMPSFLLFRGAAALAGRGIRYALYQALGTGSGNNYGSSVWASGVGFLAPDPAHELTRDMQTR